MKAIKVILENSRFDLYIPYNTTLDFFVTLIKSVNENNKVRWNNKEGAIEVFK